MNYRHIGKQYNAKTNLNIELYNNDTIPIKGARIDLLKNQGLIATILTNDVGKIHFNDVDTGYYTMRISYQGNVYTVDNFLLNDISGITDIYLKGKGLKYHYYRMTDCTDGTYEYWDFSDARATKTVLYKDDIY